MKASLGIIVLGGVVSACYVRTHVQRLDSPVILPPTCEAGVAIIPHDSAPNGAYVAIARIRISYPSDVQFTPSEEQRVQRKKAAELGATGLVVAGGPCGQPGPGLRIPRYFRSGR